MQAIMSYVVYVVINCFTPGPGNILALNTVTSYGVQKGKYLFLGIFAGYYVVQIICAIFVYYLNAYLNPVMTIMKYIGAGYILWLAYHVGKSKPVHEEDGRKKPAFLIGFMLQFVNVKIYLFGITALTGYVTPYYSSFWMLLLFEIMIASAGVIATSTWIGCGSLLQTVWYNHYKGINVAMALFLIWCAIGLLIE